MSELQGTVESPEIKQCDKNEELSDVKLPFSGQFIENQNENMSKNLLYNSYLDDNQGFGYKSNTQYFTNDNQMVCCFDFLSNIY